MRLDRSPTHDSTHRYPHIVNLVRRWLGNITGDVALDPSISVTAKAVYMVLAMHADRVGGSIHPGVAYISRHVGVSDKTVRRALVDLEKAGVVRRDAQFSGGRQVQNAYTLLDIQAVREGH